ncbi:hypothetical protein HDA32_001147 [Spinactinospora alkalitolerans]|uniref:Uncharacterized protein n=1 Tax=Spinactinospora alkalitolerans TaxID=687207 RepID=A0A852TRV6_9ACTN|nr:hypothetical protein [Spinactinospora alkalitolerans]NYE46027.1 hypothetical protein [Spinactinospora alkalitolerans]
MSEDRQVPQSDQEMPERSVSDQDLTEFLLELPSSERRRLMTLLATRVEPRRIAEPLAEQVQQLLADLDVTALSKADAKDTVRRALVETMKARQTHLAQLAQLRQLCDESDRSGALERKVHDFCQSAGLLQVTNMDDPSLFRVVSGSGEYAVVERPAYVDSADGRLVIVGEIRLTSIPPERSGVTKRQGQRPSNLPKRGGAGKRQGGGRQRKGRK